MEAIAWGLVIFITLFSEESIETFYSLYDSVQKKQSQLSMYKLWKFIYEQCSEANRSDRAFVVNLKYILRPRIIRSDKGRKV